MDAYKSRRTFQQGAKNQVRTVFEELKSCDTDENIIQLCVKLAIGKKISDDALKVQNPTTKSNIQDADRDLFDEKTQEKIKSIKEIEQEYVHNRVIYKSYSNNKKGPFYFHEPNADDWRIPPDPKVEHLMRTILPTPSENVFVGLKKYTPVSIIFTSGRPAISLSQNDAEKKLGTFKCCSVWEHYVISPSQTETSKSVDAQENLAERFYLLFKTLGLASPKMGRSVDKKVFKEIITKHSLLKNVIGMSDNPDKTFFLVPKIPFDERDTNFLKSNKYIQTKQSLKLKFNSLRIDKPDKNNSGASIIDIDALSSGLSHLTTLTNATVITFYVESDYETDGVKYKLIEELVRPYLIASETIIDMFLDFREFGPRFQHLYALNIHGGTSFNKEAVTKAAKPDPDRYKEIEKQRDDFFIDYYAKGSLMQKYPNYLNAKLYPSSTQEKNKITDFRTTLAFSFCWKNDKASFDCLYFTPNPDLAINAPTPYRFAIPI